MTGFQDTNPEAWARGQARAEAGADAPTVPTLAPPEDPWDDLGGAPDNVHPIRPKAAAETPARPDRVRAIIAGIRRQLDETKP